MAAMKKDFGAFELHEKIGSGGMASVYLGVQKSLDRKVVLKVLYPHLAEDEKLVQRFEREARAAAMLRHENIVQVIDCGRFEDVSYIAMEFVEGLDLKKWMEQYGPPPLEVALVLIRDLAHGLEHAHQHRIVHRDIKPANIMLTPDGALKIMDFGLARRGEDSTAVTVVGSVMGTPAYMSPEQATGEAVDERSDIFSAGVVAYELLGGTRPFQGDSYSTVLRSILTLEPRPLSSFNPLVPEEVVNIVQKMLQKDVSRRYARIGMVRGDIETAMEQLSMTRSRDLIREYAQNPVEVGERLKKKRLARHLDQGLYFENMGLSKIDDALLEFQRVVYLDPDNATAQEHLRKLESERAKIQAERASAAVPAESDATMVMTPEEAARMAREAQQASTTSGARPAAAPPAPPARPAAKPSTAELPALPAKGARPVARPATKADSAPASGSPKGLLIGAAVALVVVLAAAGWFLFGRGGSGSESEPPAAPVTGAQTPATPPGGTQTTPPAPAGGDAGVTPAGAATASLEIVTEPPGATILVNGTAEAKKSKVTRTDLAPGAYTLRAEKSGYEPAEQSVTLAGGDNQKVTLTLAPTPGMMGTLTIRAVPYGTFYVNDKAQGQPNVITSTASLKPGLYTVRAENPNFPTQVWKNVRIEPNQTTSLSHDFQQVEEGTLAVPTPPQGWAYVWLDNKNTGKTTPAKITGLKPGSYAVTLVREGFTVVGGARKITIKNGQTTTVEFALKPINP